MNYLMILFLFLAFNAPADNYELTLSIDNIKEAKGTIEVGVFNTTDGFLEEGKAFKTYSIPVNGKTITYTIKDLPEGNYAISMFQDKNTDGKCNLNFIGIPKEPYGFSNNFKPKFSAPSFKDCSFSLISDKTLNINLID